MCATSTKDSHHRYMWVTLIAQILFHQGQFSRDISLNAKYIVVLKNVHDKKLFE